jgi:hypothetical protein
MLSSLMNWLRSPSSRPKTDILDVLSRPEPETPQHQM